jgi:methionyl-tRNA formyltransferase
MRVVFMGSPEFSIPTLKLLYGQFQIVGIVTQPDRPAGRGRAIRHSAVKTWGIEHDIPIIQPSRIRDPEVLNQIIAWEPIVIVVAAYGQIIPDAILDYPQHGCLNVHASLLPRWRGAAPVQASILHGDQETGVTIMRMDAGLDTGPILSKRHTAVLEEETGGELTARLALIGGELLIDTLTPYLQGDIQLTLQDESQATYAPMLKKSDGLLNFSLPAEQLTRQVRAYEPWPSSFFLWGSRRITVRKAHVSHRLISETGVVYELGGELAVGAGENLLVLDIVQPSGRNSMAGVEFIRGAREFVGSNLVMGS